MSDMDFPVIVIIKGCENAFGPSAMATSACCRIRSANSTEAARAFMADVLTCWECWDRDEAIPVDDDPGYCT